MANRYALGNQVRCSVTFKDINGNVADPTTVTAVILSPDGTETTYVYGTSGTWVKTSTGIYAVDVTPGVAGIWHYQLLGAGVLKAADEDYFIVLDGWFS